MASEPAVDILDTGEAGGRVIRGGAFRSVGYVLGVGLAALSAPLLTRHLGVVDYGKLVTVTSIVFIVGALTEGGLTSVGVREYAARSGADRMIMLRNLLAMRVALTLGGVAAAVAFTALAGYGVEMVAGAAIAGAALVVGNVYYTYAVPLQAGLRLIAITVIDLVRQAVAVAAVALLVLAGAGLVPFFATALAGVAAALLLAGALIRSEVDLRPAFERARWVELARAALPFAAATAVGVVYFRTTTVVTSLVASELETGYYNAAFRIVEIVAGVPYVLATSAFPLLVRAARDDTDRLRYAMQRLTEISAIVGGWIAVMIWIGAAVAIDVIAGDDFAPASRPLQVMGVAMAASFVLATWGFVLLAVHRTRELLVANLAALLASAILAVILARSHGAVGAAVATAITEGVLAAAYLVALAVGRRDLMPRWRPFVPIAIAIAIAATVATVVPLAFYGQAVAATAAYLFALVLGRAIPPELVRALRRRGA